MTLFDINSYKNDWERGLRHKNKLIRDHNIKTYGILFKHNQLVETMDKKFKIEVTKKEQEKKLYENELDILQSEIENYKDILNSNELRNENDIDTLEN